MQPINNRRTLSLRFGEEHRNNTDDGGMNGGLGDGGEGGNGDSGGGRIAATNSDIMAASTSPVIASISVAISKTCYCFSEVEKFLLLMTPLESPDKLPVMQPNKSAESDCNE
jgi:hypothetical protein